MYRRKLGSKYMPWSVFKQVAPQRGKQPCYICKSRPGDQVDHDHKTGKFRGFLCGPCDRGVGWFERFREAMEGYLLTYG